MSVVISSLMSKGIGGSFALCFTGACVSSAAMSASLSRNFGMSAYDALLNCNATECASVFPFVSSSSLLTLPIISSFAPSCFWFLKLVMLAFSGDSFSILSAF